MDIYCFSFYIFMCICHSFINTGYGQVNDEICNKVETGVTFMDNASIKVETTKGRSYIATDLDYAFSCCGMLTNWKALFVAKGSVKFQIWRYDAVRRGQRYKLIGENTYKVKDGDLGKPIDFHVHLNDRVLVLPGDVIGWFYVDKELIGYKTSEVVARGRGFWRRHIGERPLGTNINWSLGTFLYSRKYSIGAKIERNSPPYFKNLYAFKVKEISINYSKAVGDIIYTILVGDKEFSDVYILDVSMTTASDYFELEQDSLSLRVKKDLVKGSRHKLDFSVEDLCQHKITASLYIIVSGTSSQKQTGKPLHVWIIGIAVSLVICIVSISILLIYSYLRWKRENQVMASPDDFTRRSKTIPRKRPTVDIITSN